MSTTNNSTRPEEATAVPIDTSGSVPPPSAPQPAAAAQAESRPTAPEQTPAIPVDTSRGESADRPSLAEAEALAKVAAIAAEGRGTGGPSRAIVGTAIGLGVLIVALLILALALSV
jgi:hypothetical protein